MLRRRGADCADARCARASAAVLHRECGAGGGWRGALPSDANVAAEERSLVEATLAATPPRQRNGDERIGQGLPRIRPKQCWCEQAPEHTRLHPPVAVLEAKHQPAKRRRIEERRHRHPPRRWRRNAGRADIGPKPRHGTERASVEVRHHGALASRAQVHRPPRAAPTELAETREDRPERLHATKLTACGA